MKMVKIGIMGGSGLDNPDILKDAKDKDVKTIYGEPTSPLKIGKIGNIDVVLIAIPLFAFRMPYSITKKAWYLLLPDIIGFTVALILIWQWLIYEVKILT